MSVHPKTVTVRAIRPFEGQEGFKSPASEPFRVSRHRAAELKANNLVEEVDEVESLGPDDGAPPEEAGGEREAPAQGAEPGSAGGPAAPSQASARRKG